MSDSAFDRVVDALRDNGREVKGDQGKAMAQCPAHDDNSPSLSIGSRRDGNGIVLKCHAGCETADVLAALNLMMADLFDEPTVKAIYRPRRDYRYPGGRIVHRHPGKDFPQSVPKSGDKSLFGAERITDAVATVYVCEGEKDCEAVAAAGGVAVCSAMGAGKSHLADWTPLRGKNVVIIADRDKPGRDHAAEVLGLVLLDAKNATIVEAAVGKDFADHFAAGYGLDELVTVKAVSDPESAVGAGGTGSEPLPAQEEQEREVFPSPSAPLDVARRIYASYRRNDGLRTLLSWRSGWMDWQNTHWAELDPAALRSRVYDVLGAVDYMKPIRKNGEIDHYERTPWDPNKRKVSDVLEAMQAVGHLSTDVDPPAWIDQHQTETVAAQMVSCANGLLDLVTRTVHSHSPALFNVVSVPFAYDENAPEPRAWLDFLASIWSEDPESVMLLQQFLGYILSGRTDMQKLLLLIGPTRSGKGTVARMLTELIGRGHVAGPTLASLGTNFGLSPLLGKPLAVVSDARLGSTPAHTVVERLLSITGEDMLTVDRKFRDPWSGKLPTRFVILSNELPKFSDSSGAIANRLLILQMTNSFLGREDRTLDRRLRAELPGILNWCLDGLDQLNRAGRFAAPQSSSDSTTLMMDLASPMSAFVRDKCVREPDATVETDVLYSAWKTWCEDNGHRSTAKSTFGRDLRAVVPEIRVAQPRSDGGRGRHYERIGIAKTSTHNADHPVPPVPPQSGMDRHGIDSEVKSQVNATGTGGTGKSALQSPSDDQDGIDPCKVCGFPPPPGYEMHHDCARVIATKQSEQGALTFDGGAS